MIINIWKNFKFRLPARWFRDEVPCGFWDCCDVRCSWASIFEDIGCSFSVGVSAHQLNVPLSSTDPSSTTLCPIIIIINYHHSKDYSNARHVGKIIILAVWSLYETKMLEFFFCKCKNKFSTHFNQNCSDTILLSNYFIEVSAFFLKKNDSFYIHTYALMSQCMRKVPNGNIQSRIKDFVVFYVREYMLRCPNWILSCWFHFCWKCTAASTKTKVSYE